jgi:hypothetical protein
MIRENVEEGKAAATAPVQRLCNEIQLFDLCDLEKCSYKVGKFCSDSELLTAFEHISDAEVVRPEAFISEEEDEGDEVYGEEYDEDEFDEDAEYDYED